MKIFFMIFVFENEGKKKFLLRHTQAGTSLTDAGRQQNSGKMSFNLIVPKCVHPSRMYDLFSDWDGEAVWRRRPLFYEDMTDNATSIMQEVDNEIQAVATALREKHRLDVQVPRVVVSQ